MDKNAKFGISRMQLFQVNMYLSQNWVPDNVNGLVFSSWRPSTGPLVLLALNQLPALHPPPGLGPSCRRHWLQAPPARHSLACPAQLTVGLWTLRTVNSNQLGGVKLVWLGLTDQKKGKKFPDSTFHWLWALGRSHSLSCPDQPTLATFFKCTHMSPTSKKKSKHKAWSLLCPYRSYAGQKS